MGAIEDILKRFGNDTVYQIRSNMSSTKTDASGDTSKSLESRVSGKNLKVLGNEFIYVVETGRKAGKRPPVSKIVKWLQSGKVSFSGTIEGVAFAVSKKIGEEGSSLFRKGGRKDIITPVISNNRINELMDELSEAAANEYINSIDDA